AAAGDSLRERLGPHAGAADDRPTLLPDRLPGAVRLPTGVRVRALVGDVEVPEPGALPVPHLPPRSGVGPPLRLRALLRLLPGREDPGPKVRGRRRLLRGGEAG